MLYQELSRIIDRSVCNSEDTFNNFSQRVKEGKLTRDENLKSHFCAYFLPHNPKTNKVFIAHHKKAGLWLSPGGHIDTGEKILDTLNREINEELGIKNFFKNEQNPFLLTITPIDNSTQLCKEHFDLWYLMRTEGKQFKIDSREFHDSKWMTIEEAKSIITDQSNLKALESVEKITKNYE